MTQTALPDEEMFSRVTALEETTRLQSVEITLLKSALADVLTKLAAQEEEIQSNSVKKAPIKSKGREFYFWPVANLFCFDLISIAL